MKIELWSIGKENEKMYKDAIAEFDKRINRYIKYKLVVINSKANTSAPIAAQLQTEGEQILQVLQDTDTLIVLDDKGKSLTTKNLASNIEKWLQLPAKRIVILIGGAYGISDAVKAKAHFTWSLSALTFPHQLVRLIVGEQLYRAFSVINNEKYHHE